MNIDTKQKKILDKAIETWGRSDQENNAIGECGEFLGLFGKRAQNRDSEEDWISEIADVIVMMEQMALIVGYDKVKAMVEFKITRLKGKLDNFGVTWNDTQTSFPLSNRMEEIIIAGAIGDSIGYIVEFMKYKDIIKQYGDSGLTLSHVNPMKELLASDDTQMTLFLLECFSNSEIIKNIDSKTIRISFIDWLNTQINKVDKYSKSKLVNFASMLHPRAPGNTCLSALQNNYNLSHPVNSSKGCGAIMRTAPCAFVPEFGDAIALAVVQAQVTHGHPSGYIPAEIFTKLLYYILHTPDTDLLMLLNGCIKDEKNNPLAKETIECLEMAISLSKKVSYPLDLDVIVKDIHSIGGGWMGHDALAIAVYCVLVSTTFEQVIQLSINHDGDSDSTGSLAAQLWVAMFGLESELYNVYNKIDIKDAIDYTFDLDYKIFKNGGV